MVYCIHAMENSSSTTQNIGFMHTYTRNGIDFCSACGLELTATRAMNLAHECDKSDLYSKAIEYRNMLENMCNSADTTGCDGLACITTEVLDEAKELLGWDT
jgi:hypothetical protein